MDELYKNLTNQTINIDEFLQSLEAANTNLQIFLIVLYSLTALLALGGNATVIMVLMFGKRSSRELRIFLINLAVSDVCMALFSIPFTYTHYMLGRWIFHPGFCPFVQFMQHVSVIASVYTLTAIGVDRYFAIMNPLNPRCTKSRSPIIVALIWIVAGAMSSFQLLQSKSDKVTVQGEDIYDCSEGWGDVGGKVYTGFIFVLTFALPMAVLSFVYSSIAVKMYRHHVPGNADASRDQQQLTAKIKVLKMLITVVILFALCWLPIHIFGLLLYFDRDVMVTSTASQENFQTAVFFVCHWLSMANSFANPIVYCFMSDNFRTDLRQLLFCCCAIRPRHLRRRLKSDHSSFRTTTLVLSSCSVKHPPPAIPLRPMHPDAHTLQ